jgi:hypothetical protein
MIQVQPPPQPGRAVVVVVVLQSQVVVVGLAVVVVVVLVQCVTLPTSRAQLVSVQSPAVIGQNSGCKQKQAFGFDVVVVLVGLRGQLGGNVVVVVVGPPELVVVVVVAGAQLSLTRSHLTPSLLTQEHLPEQGLP